MKLSTTTIIQVATWLAAVLVMIQDAGLLADQQTKAWVGIAAGAISLAIHQHSGKRNPDGTDARAPYEPPTKPLK